MLDQGSKEAQMPQLTTVLAYPVKGGWEGVTCDPDKGIATSESMFASDLDGLVKELGVEDVADVRKYRGPDFTQRYVSEIIDPNRHRVDIGAAINFSSLGLDVA